jgi:glycosyltransferase involved in cell wall biosynthesis
MPVFLATSRPWLGGIRTYTKGVQAALEAVGITAEIVALPPFRELRVGGVILPMMRMLVSRHPPRRFVHAVDTESCYRGTAVFTVQNPLSLADPGRLAGFAGQRQMALALHHAKRVIAVSQATAEEVRRRFPEASAKLCAIPLTFDTRVGPIVAKEREAIWVGRHEPYKGLLTFLDALNDPQLSDVSTLVQWSPQPEYSQQALQARTMLKSLPNVEAVERKVDFGQLSKWLAGSRCIVSTSSRAEGFHAVIMEAYIRRTRVVIPRIPPYTETYSPAAEGVHWYEPGSRDALVRAVRTGTSAPPQFTPDPATLDRVSYRTVGTAIKEAYVHAGWRES